MGNLRYEYIPKGYEVHHIDLDDSNNHINNLIAIPQKIHDLIHEMYSSEVWQYDLDKNGNIDYSTKRRDAPTREDIKHLIIYDEVSENYKKKKASLEKSGKLDSFDTPLGIYLLKKGYPKKKLTHNELRAVNRFNEKKAWDIMPPCKKPSLINKLGEK